jgi:hypothetical protein
LQQSDQNLVILSAAKNLLFLSSATNLLSRVVNVLCWTGENLP